MNVFLFIQEKQLLFIIHFISFLFLICTHLIIMLLAVYAYGESFPK